MFFIQKFGRMVRNKRELRRMSIEHTAELCGLSAVGLSLIEFGDSNPKLSTVLSIARVLDIDLGELNSIEYYDEEGKAT